MCPQSRFQLPQNYELDPRAEIAGAYELIYAFSRSSARQKNDYPGADYLSFYYKDNRFIFVVCDGVSGAFAGYVAAKFIGDQLINWANQISSLDNLTHLGDELTSLLKNWTIEGTELVNSVPLRPQGDDTDRDFMERRRKRGSQSMFLLGIFDMGQNFFSCFGLGDIRVSVNTTSKTTSELLKGSTQERWSTLEGNIGNLWSRSFAHSEISSISVYTDGFEQFIDVPSSPFSRQQLEKIQSPDDDVTVLSVRLNKDFLKYPKATLSDYSISGSNVIFGPVGKDQWIRVFVEDSAIDVFESKLALGNNYNLGQGKVTYQVVGLNVQPSELGFVKLGQTDLTKEKHQWPTYINERKRPQVSTPPTARAEPRAPINVPTLVANSSAIALAGSATNTDKTQTTEHVRKSVFTWGCLLGFSKWVLAILGWVFVVYFLLQTAQQRNTIKDLTYELEIYQQKAIKPTSVPVLTETPTSVPDEISPTPSTPLSISLMECKSINDGMVVFLEPDVNTLPLFMIPKGHHFSIIQEMEDEDFEKWSYITDNVILINGWVKSRDISATATCTEN